MGCDALLVSEVKPTVAPAQVQTVIDMVEERNLDRAVLMQSSTYAAVKQTIDAGLDCLYLQGRNLPPEPLEQLRAEGVEC